MAFEQLGVNFFSLSSYLLGSCTELHKDELRCGQSDLAFSGEYGISPGLAQGGQFPDVFHPGENPNPGIQLARKPNHFLTSMHARCTEKEGDGTLCSRFLEYVAVSSVAVDNQRSFCPQALYGIQIQLDNYRFY
jgi:hypothetical protein